MIQTVLANESPVAPVSPPFSRWALSVEFTPGIGYIFPNHDDQLPPFLPTLGAALLGSYYTLDQCALPNLKTCIQLPLHLRLSTVHYIKEVSASLFELAFALEPTFFFGRQRTVGLTIFTSAQYQYAWLRNPSDEDRVAFLTHSIRFSLGIGCVFNLQAVRKGLEAYLRLETSSENRISIPIGIRYRF